MFAEIILSQRFPKHLGIFDYRIPDALLPQIKIGQLVTIPFRSSEREGIVINLKETGITGKQIKEIIKINQAEPTLTSEQIKLAEWMHQYYFVSLGTIIKMMLPPVPKKSATTKESAYPPARTPSLPIAVNELILALVTGRQSTFLYWPRQMEEKQQFLYWLIKRTKGTILLIVPKITDIQEYFRLLSPKLRKKTAVVSSQLNKNQFHAAWQNIISGRATLVIGTKLALFAPVQKPELIIMDQAEDEGHKQSDQNPRFDGRDVAEKLASLHQTKLLYVSHASSVNLYQRISAMDIQLLTAKPPPRQIELIDLREERKKQNYSPFSDRLTAATSATLSGGKKVFLFINKRGSAASVVCRDCGQGLTCHNCGATLVYHQNTQALYCHHCHNKSEIPPFCPHCSSVDFKFTGLGTQKVEQEARHLWPDKKIVRLDKDTGAQPNISSYDIIIGTEFALSRLAWEYIGLIGVISIDTLLNIPDFRAHERTWQLLTGLQYHSDCPLLIQTYTPQTGLLHQFKEQDEKAFYRTELQERAMLDYPPSGQLVKLIFSHADKKTCLETAQKLLRFLKTTPLTALLLTPLSPLQHKKWSTYIIIKYHSPQQDSTLANIMRQIPQNWIIDRDPVSLL